MTEALQERVLDKKGLMYSQGKDTNGGQIIA